MVNLQPTHRHIPKSNVSQLLLGIVIWEGIGENLIVCEEKKDKERKTECEGEEEEKKEEEDSVHIEKKKEKKLETRKKSALILDLPYPHAPTRKDKERKFLRFRDILKQLQINIPFT